MLFLTGSLLNLIGTFTSNKFFKRLLTLTGILILAWFAGTVSVDHSFDTGTYSGAYILNPDTAIFEPGYLNLTYWFYSHGFTYQQFRIITYFLFYLIFYFIIIHFSNNPNFFLFVYAFFPFLNDAIQVRNFFMLMFAGLSLIALEKKTFFRFSIAVLLIYISSQFQTTGAMFYLLILLRAIPFEQVFKNAPRIIVLIAIFSGLLWITGSINLVTRYFSNLSLLSDRDGISNALTVYSSGTVNRYSLTIIFSYLLILFIAQSTLSELIEKHELTSKYEVLYLMTLLGAIGIPAMFSSFAFERILRNSIIFGILIITDLKINKGLKKGMGVRYVLFGVALLLGIYAKGYLNNSEGMMGSYTLYMLHFIK